MTDTQLAANREALFTYIWPYVGNDDQTKAIIDRLFTGGALRDADEVRREGFLTERAGAWTQYVRLRAAIETIRPDATVLGRPAISVQRLSALLADDGDGALREHDEQVRNEQGKRLAKEYRRRADQTDEMRAATSDGNPMRAVWHGEASAYRYAADYAEYRDTIEYRSLEERIDQEAVYELDDAGEAGE